MGTQCVNVSNATYFCTHTKRISYSPCSRSVGNGQHLSSTSHIDTSMTYCPLITRIWELSRSDVSPKLEMKDTTKSNSSSASYLDILLSTVGTVIFALPFTTSATMLISILQNFRSWEATYHFRPPMAFLSHSSSDTSGLAPLINVFLRAVRLSNKLLGRYFLEIFSNAINSIPVINLATNIKQEIWHLFNNSNDSERSVLYPIQITTCFKKHIRDTFPN